MAALNADIRHHLPDRHPRRAGDRPFAPTIEMIDGKITADERAVRR